MLHDLFREKNWIFFQEYKRHHHHHHHHRLNFFFKASCLFLYYSFFVFFSVGLVHFCLFKLHICLFISAFVHIMTAIILSLEQTAIAFVLRATDYVQLSVCLHFQLVMSFWSKHTIMVPWWIIPIYKTNSLYLSVSAITCKSVELVIKKLEMFFQEMSPKLMNWF